MNRTTFPKLNLRVGEFAAAMINPIKKGTTNNPLIVVVECIRDFSSATDDEHLRMAAIQFVKVVDYSNASAFASLIETYFDTNQWFRMNPYQHTVGHTLRDILNHLKELPDDMLDRSAFCVCEDGVVNVTEINVSAERIYRNKSNPEEVADLETLLEIYRVEEKEFDLEQFEIIKPAYFQ